MTPNPRVYSIADKDILQTAGELAAGLISEEYEHERAKNHWRDDVEEEIAVDEKWGYGRHITKADTLVELALKIKIDLVSIIGVGRWAVIRRNGVEPDHLRAGAPADHPVSDRRRIARPCG